VARKRLARRRHWLAKIFLYVVLEVGALSGVPMRPEQIESLLRSMNGTQVVDVLRRESDGDPPD
jgi:hypothetical protein